MDLSGERIVFAATLKRKIHREREVGQFDEKRYTDTFFCLYTVKNGYIMGKNQFFQKKGIQILFFICIP